MIINFISRFVRESYFLARENAERAYERLKSRDDLKYGDLPTAKCDECGKIDHTVYERACGYQQDINGIDDSMETICDDCEHGHLMDI